MQTLQNAFTVLFFVAVGMMFDPTILLRQPLQVLVVVGIVIIGKSLAAFLIVPGLRYPIQTGLTVSASLTQIGEFSFILVGLGVSLGMLPPEGLSLVVAGATNGCLTRTDRRCSELALAFRSPIAGSKSPDHTLAGTSSTLLKNWVGGPSRLLLAIYALNAVPQ